MLPITDERPLFSPKPCLHIYGYASRYYCPSTGAFYDLIDVVNIADFFRVVCHWVIWNITPEGYSDKQHIILWEV